MSKLPLKGADFLHESSSKLMQMSLDDGVEYKKKLNDLFESLDHIEKTMYSITSKNSAQNITNQFDARAMVAKEIEKHNAEKEKTSKKPDPTTSLTNLTAKSIEKFVNEHGNILSEEEKKMFSD
jgi:hypothetical protein